MRCNQSGVTDNVLQSVGHNDNNTKLMSTKQLHDIGSNLREELVTDNNDLLFFIRPSKVVRFTNRFYGDTNFAQKIERSSTSRIFR